MFLESSLLQRLRRPVATLAISALYWAALFPPNLALAQSAKPDQSPSANASTSSPAATSSQTAPDPSSTGDTSSTSASTPGGPVGADAESSATAGVAPQVAVAGSLNSFETDQFTGHFGYRVPIKVAPGRAGMQPNIVLSYNSGSGNGWCGVGWSLDMGHIERETRNGVPVTRPPAAAMYDDSKGFTFSLNGMSSRLVADSGSTTQYHAHIEGGFLTFTYNSSARGWTVKDKSGRTYTFGSTADSRMENPHFGSIGDPGTFRWNLNKVADANGNVMTLQYVPDAGQVYLSKILYNNTSTSPGTHQVDFILEDNKNGLAESAYPNSAISGYVVQTRKRLKEIKASVGGSQAYHYVLTYGCSNLTHKALLASVSEFGSDDTPTLKPVTFGYQQSTGNYGFGPMQPWSGVSIPSGATAKDYGRLRADYPNAQPDQTETNERGDQTTGYANVTYVGLMDVDRDGLPDRIMTGGASNYLAQRNNGVGFDTALVPWGKLEEKYNGAYLGLNYTSRQPFSDGRSYNFTRLDYMDINGDGLPDRVKSYYNPYPTNTKKDWLVQFGTENTGASAFPVGQSYWPNPRSRDLRCNRPGTAPGIGAGSTIQDLIDMDGDGKPDNVSFLKEGTPFGHDTEVHVRLNNGTGFQSDDVIWTNLDNIYVTDQADFGSNGYNYETLHGLFDLNGDGLPDWVRHDPDPDDNNRNHFFVYPNYGSGIAGGNDPVFDYGAVPDMKTPGNDGQVDAMQSYVHGTRPNGATFASLVDINGDGLPDRVVCNNSGFFRVWINVGSSFAASPVDYTGVDAGGRASGEGGLAIEGGHGNKVQLMDINGDGLPDRVMCGTDSQGYSAFYVQLNQGPYPDLLSYVGNGIGGAVGVTYKPSTTCENRNQGYSGDPWASNRPATDFWGNNSIGTLGQVMYVTSTVTVWDGINANTTTYDYYGGYFSYAAREFRGFNRVRVTDPLGTQTVTYFHQGVNRPDGSFEKQMHEDYEGKQGMVYKKVVQDKDHNEQSNNPYSITVNRIALRTLDGGTTPTLKSHLFSYVDQSVTREQGGFTSRRATGMAYAYDDNGNLTTETNYGEVDSSTVDKATFQDEDYHLNGGSIYSDAVTKTMTYAKGGRNDGIIDKPDTITWSNAAGTKLRKTVFTFDGAGNVLTQSRRLIQSGGNGANIEEVANVYDGPFGSLSSTRDASDVTTVFSYNDDYQVYPTSQTVGGDWTISTTHDPRSGNVTLTKDQRNVTTKYEYDNVYRIWLVYTYVGDNGDNNSNNLKIEYSYGLGQSALGDNWTQKIVHPHGSFAASSGSSYPQVQDQSDLLSKEYYDGLGRLIESRSVSEKETSDSSTVRCRVSDTTYDGRGAVTFVTRPRFSTSLGYTGYTSDAVGTSTHYDAQGRPDLITPPPDNDPGSPTGPTRMDYSFKRGSDAPDQWLTQTTDPAGSTRWTYHDAFGRTAGVVEINGPAVADRGSTFYVYDPLGQLTDVRNVSYQAGSSQPQTSQKTYIVYDSLGRKTSVSLPATGTTTQQQWSYTYNNAPHQTGQLFSQTDPNGNTICFEYEQQKHGRLLRKYIPNTATTAEKTLCRYFYDSYQGMVPPQEDSTTDPPNLVSIQLGDLAGVTDLQGETYFRYDALGRQAQKGHIISPPTIGLKTFVTSYTYDLLDRVTSIRYPKNAHGSTPASPILTIRNWYDAGGHLSSIDQGSGTTNLYSADSFDSLDQPSQIIMGDHSRTLYTYYPGSRRLAQYEVKTLDNSANVLLKYTYNKIGRILSVTDGVRSGGASDGVSNVQYDPLHRLIGATSGSDGLARTYGYDKLGRITTNGDNQTPGSTGPLAYSYNDPSHPFAVTSANNTSYTYDNSGNRRTRKKSGEADVTYNYDAENRLTSVIGATTETYGYDYTGARLWKQAASQINVYLDGLYEWKTVMAGPSNPSPYSSDSHELAHVHAGGQLVATIEKGADTTPPAAPVPGEDPGNPPPTQPPTPPSGPVDGATFVLQQVPFNGTQFHPGEAQPVELVAGRTATVKMVMRNTGTTTWSTANRYGMKVATSSAWGLKTRVELPGGSDVPPAGTNTGDATKVKFVFDIRVPSTPGDYTLQCRMKKSYDSFGDQTEAITIRAVPDPNGSSTNTNVNAVDQTDAANNAAYVSQALASTMAADDYQRVQVTLTNTGNTSWVPGDGRELFVVAGPWTVQSVPLDTQVDPGGSATFTLDLEVPADDGQSHVYPVQFQMGNQNQGVFGQPSPATNITVTPGTGGGSSRSSLDKDQWRGMAGVGSGGNPPPPPVAAGSGLHVPGGTWAAAQGQGWLGKTTSGLRPEVAAKPPIKQAGGGSLWLVCLLGLLGWARRVVRRRQEPLAGRRRCTRAVLPHRSWWPASAWRAVWPTLVAAVLAVWLPSAALWAEPAAVCYFYHSDHLGSTCVVTSNQGTLQDHYQSSVYGRSRAGGAGTVALPLSNRFTGQVYDTGTNLYYYQARYYDPESANFLQPDSEVPDPGDPQSLNRYSYCRNDPLNKVDPSGHGPVEVAYRAKLVAFGVRLTNQPFSTTNSELLQDAENAYVNSRTVEGMGFVHAADEFHALIFKNNDAAERRISSMSGGPVGQAAAPIIATAAIGVARARSNIVNVNIKSSNMLENAEKGRAFEKEKLPVLKQSQTDVQEQVSLRPYLDNGELADYRVRIDAVGRDQGGNLRLTDFKSSEEAGFTLRQTSGYPLLERNGGQVVGNNGGATYPAGLEIPPIRVEILRPSNF